MPDAKAHEGQETRNHLFYGTIGGKDATYSEWAVTVLFYAAVHKINAFLAGQGEHPASHTEREVALRQLDRGRAAVTHRTLKTAARGARYECARFGPSQIDHYQKLASAQLATELAQPDSASPAPKR